MDKDQKVTADYIPLVQIAYDMPMLIEYIRYFIEKSFESILHFIQMSKSQYFERHEPQKDLIVVEFFEI